LDAALGDHLLGRAPGGDTGLGQHLLQAFALTPRQLDRALAVGGFDILAAGRLGVAQQRGDRRLPLRFAVLGLLARRLAGGGRLGPTRPALGGGAAGTLARGRRPAPASGAETAACVLAPGRCALPARAAPLGGASAPGGARGAAHAATGGLGALSSTIRCAISASGGIHLSLVNSREGQSSAPRSRSASAGLRNLV